MWAEEGESPQQNGLIRPAFDVDTKSSEARVTNSAAGQAGERMLQGKLHKRTEA